MRGPFTVTVLVNRSLIINGKTYKKDDVVVLKDNQVGPELQKLIDASYVSCSPSLPTDAGFVALVGSTIDADPGAPYIAQGNAPSMDQDIADGGTYDYVHGLNSLHVGVVGRAERISGGTSVERLLAPFGKSATMDVKYTVKDDNTITIKNDTGGGSHVRVRLQAYILG